MLDKSDSDTHDDLKSTLSPIAPRSPSWREGFGKSIPSPLAAEILIQGKSVLILLCRQKKIDCISPTPDLSPTSRTSFADDTHVNKSHEPLYANVAHKPLTRSPDEVRPSASGLWRLCVFR